MSDLDWLADKARYPNRPFLKEQSSWAIWVYRFGRRVDRRKPGIRRWLLGRIYWLLYRIVETATMITLPKSADIGPGLRIYHFGPIVVHAEARIGANCTFRHGVTIGNRREHGPVPMLEDDVELGAYAQVLGGVRIGRGAKIGALSLVLCDVAAGATAVGVPARVVDTPSETGSPRNEESSAEVAM